MVTFALLSCSSCSASCGCESYIFGTGPAAQRSCQEPHCQEVTLLNCRLAVCYWSLLQSPAARTLVLDLKFCSLRVLLAREYHHRFFFFPPEVTKSILFKGPVCKICMEARLTAYFTYRALSSWFPQKWMMEYVS